MNTVTPASQPSASASAATSASAAAQSGPRIPRTPHTAPTFWQSVWMVATREIVARLRSKAFLISTGILLALSLGSVIVGGLVGANATLPKVAVVGTASQIVEQATGLDAVPTDSVEAAEALVRDGTVSAAVVPAPASPSAPLGIEVIALDSPPSDVINALSVYPEVTLLEPSPANGILVYFVALGFGLVFFMSALTFGTTIAQSVVEEKQTRVVEILMSTIPVRALMAGKVLGNSILAFGQIVLIGVLVSAGMAVTGQRVLLGDMGPSMICLATRSSPALPRS